MIIEYFLNIISYKISNFLSNRHGIDLEVDANQLISQRHEGRLRGKGAHYLREENKERRAASVEIALTDPTSVLNMLARTKGVFTEKDTAYYSEQERSSLKLKIQDGKLYGSSDDSPIDTQNSFGFDEPAVTDVVVGVDGQLFCYGGSHGPHKEGMQHHSGILSGGPVLFAGEIGVKDGEIVKITMRSGHYMPKEKHLLSFLVLLAQQGIKLENVILKDGIGGGVISNNAAEWFSRNHKPQYEAVDNNRRSRQSSVFRLSNEEKGDSEDEGSESEPDENSQVVNVGMFNEEDDVENEFKTGEDGKRVYDNLDPDEVKREEGDNPVQPWLSVT